MTPLICHKDRVTAERTAVEDIRLGDIVLYQVSRDQLAVHRIIHKTLCDHQATLLTKADNLLFAEPPISTDRILARVIAVEKSMRTIRFDSRLSHFFNRWLARYSYGIHLLASELRSLKRALVRDKKYPILDLAQKTLRTISNSLAWSLVNLTFSPESR